MALIDVYDVGLHLPAYVSLAAALACVLLLPLYFSQRRDLLRLHAWMEREPGHPAADMAASEALLDRAETELEQFLGTEYQAPSADQADEQAVAEPTLVAPPVPAPAGSGPQRVTTERPALERITTERAALLPHPRRRRLVARVTQPRVLSAMAAAAVVLGLVAIFASEQFLEGDGGSGKGPKPGSVEPGDVEVAVLNGTSVPGLAAKVGDDVKVNGFRLGTVTNSRDQFDQTVVMYARGQQPAGKKVAHDLGVKPLQPIDRQTERTAGDADVVVIAGADRAQP
ncbi:MAG TPA: LytR C-terminal domain-containing protein [Solirubrobacterales bacterium]|nr:LytR C-terminal domain-containing protein [Solirubrobacterales bacterium]